MSAQIKGKLPAIIAAVAVVALGGGGLFALSKNGEAETKTEKSASAKAPEIKPGDPVVAKIGETEIKRSQVLNFIGEQPEQVRQMPIDSLFPAALEQVINNTLVDEKAAAAKLDADPEVVKMQEDAKKQILRSVYVERQLDASVSNKEVLKEYEALLDKLKGVQETKARHILVESEEKAREIITKLDEGAKFEELAKAESKDPSAQKNSGELGYFSKGDMVPEFADAAFALDVGQYTKDPVKTQFGWHVIQAQDRRDRAEPEYEAVKPQLEAQLRQKKLVQMVQDWQKESSIKKFDINGEPLKEEKPAKAAEPK